MWVRGFQLLFGFVLLVSIDSSIRVPEFHHWANLAFMIGFLGIFIFLTTKIHPLAFGYADMTGLTFHRYLTRTHLRWDEVSALTWEEGGIHVFPRKGSPAGSHLLFSLFDGALPVSALWDSKVRDSKPPVVSWLEELLSSHPTAPKFSRAQKLEEDALWERYKSGTLRKRDIVSFLLHFGAFIGIWLLASYYRN